MQHGLPTSPEIILELIDADGAYFNSKLYSLLDKLAHMHGDVIIEDYLARLNANDVDTVKPPSAAIQQIIDTLDAPLTEDEMKRVDSQRAINITKVQASNKRIVRLQELWAGANFMVKSNLHTFNSRIEFSSLRRDEHDTNLEGSPFVNFQAKLHPALRQAVMLKANENLVAHLRTHVKPNAIVYLGTGSNRQCLNFDFQGEMFNETTSFFDELLNLTNHLRRTNTIPNADIRLFPVTTTDGKHDLPHGTIFRYKLSGVTLKPHVSVFDETKISLIYFMAHTMSKQHPDSPLTVHFYDDRRDDIIKALTQFYSTHADLLPSTVTLKLQSYYFGELFDTVTIKGTGVRDDNVNANYQTLLKLCQTAKLRKGHEVVFDSLPPKKQLEYIDECTDIDAAVHLDVEAFRKSRNLEVTAPVSTLPVILDADNCFYSRTYFYLLCSVFAKFKTDLLTVKLRVSKPLSVLSANILAYLRDLPVPAHDKITQKDINNILSAVQNIPLDKDIIEARKRVKKADFSWETLTQIHRLFDDVDSNIRIGILVRAHESLVQHIMRQAIESNCNKVDFFIGTNRQSVQLDTDLAMFHGSGRFHLDMPLFVAALNTRFAQSGLHFSSQPMLLTDYQHCLTPGTAHDSNYQDNELDHLTCFTDVSKIVLLYVLMHHIKHHIPACQRVLFYDDQSRLFTDMVDLLGEKDHVFQLFPKHLQLHFYPYNGALTPFTTNNVFTGAGNLNPNLHHVVSQIALMLSQEFKMAADSNIDMANINSLPILADLSSQLPTKLRAFNTLTNPPPKHSPPTPSLFRRSPQTPVSVDAHVGTPQLN